MSFREALLAGWDLLSMHSNIFKARCNNVQMQTKQITLNTSLKIAYTIITTFESLDRPSNKINESFNAVRFHGTINCATQSDLPF